MGTIRTQQRDVFVTEDGREFEDRHKAEAHQAELDIRHMLEENDYVGVEQDLVMQAFHRVGIYIPAALWKDLMK